MELPVDFLARMKKTLGSEYEAFLASYEKERACGLRINTLKGDKKEILKKLSFALQPIPWCDTGFYYQEEERPGKHVYHEAGIYYIQEPSAMITAELAQVVPGDVVLDLCAAPGGKTTQLACRLEGEGLLIANEINGKRAAILSQNVERMGISNGIVTNESPQRLRDALSLFFDKIVVDAPCSGEGMFKKEPVAVSEWSLENVKNCAQRQAEILECAAAMLKPGGRLVYSTCTFAEEENEENIAEFVKRHPEFRVESVHRIWPHKERGEGHFAAVLMKEGDSGRSAFPSGKNAGKSKLDKQFQKQYEVFMAENMKFSCKGQPMLFGEQLYLLPELSPELKGLKVIRPGLHVGTVKKNRIEPAHALSHALKIDQWKQSYPVTEEEAMCFLRGETIPAKGLEKGWCLVCFQEFPLGFGKYSNGILKNHYPKGLRIVGQ
ncbi:MAG: RsmF rRNA methyltransferase first C-terminal domain-containing protein [Lachnospiraceae bacterium]|nr:RsmF rRNA methyltransferase first C-terminal domain-containing protein [Lachnospiraceae bacterium]